MTGDEAALTFYNLMYQHVARRADSFDDGKLKVAHYTTAENAFKIFDGRTIWLRNAAVMNDFREISYGRDCMNVAFSQVGEVFKEIIDAKHTGLADEVLTWLNEVEHAARNHTYITSFAEHRQDDLVGKLSMWRAYGGPVAGAMIIFNTDVFRADSPQLATFPHPVIYGAAESAFHFRGMIEALKAHHQLLEAVPRERAKSVLFHAIRDLMLTTKHEGFSEEQEWRIIYSPAVLQSQFVTRKVETIGGIPQVVYKLKLEQQEGLTMPELDLDKMIYRVIIGPCQYPEQVAHAMNLAMTDAGVQDARQRISVSDIPLRQRG